jgi:hypothetical protein
MNEHPLDTARGVANGVLLSLLLWAAVLGFAALIYYPVSL